MAIIGTAINFILIGESYKNFDRKRALVKYQSLSARWCSSFTLEKPLNFEKSNFFKPYVLCIFWNIWKIRSILKSYKSITPQTLHIALELVSQRANVKMAAKCEMFSFYRLSSVFCIFFWSHGSYPFARFSRFRLWIGES